MGPTDAPLGRAMAAVLVCGPTAVLSHFAAAAVHGIRETIPETLDVTVRNGQPRSRHCLRVHRSCTLTDMEIERTCGMRVTAPARTLLDVATLVSRQELARMVEESMVQRVVDREALRAVVDAHPSRHGTALLREVTDELTDPALTRSEAERRLLDLVRAAELPRPVTNVRVGRYTVDFLWLSQRLVVEVDGFAFHGSRAAFERDRRRDADLTMAGYRVIRVTWRQIVHHPEAVIARLAALLATASP